MNQVQNYLNEIALYHSQLVESIKDQTTISEKDSLKLFHFVDQIVFSCVQLEYKIQEAIEK